MMNGLVGEAAALLRKMVSVPSFSGEETEVRDLIVGQLRAWGMEPQLVGNNIIVSHEGNAAGRKTLLLCAHIDTVRPADGYSFNPFEAGDDERVVRGLGSNDDGGCVVSMISCFRHFMDRTLPFNLFLVLSSEEETSGANGMHRLVGELCDVRNASWAIVGEPTSLQAATSERGLVVLDGETQGQSGHAGRGEGVNALYMAMEDIMTIKNHRFEKESPMMGQVRASVNQVDGGVAHNVTPDRCHYVVDVRTTEQYSLDEVCSELQQLCHGRLTVRPFSSRASSTRPGSVLLDVVHSMGIPVFSSPTTSDWMELACDAIKIGPGDSARSHKKDEYITVDEIGRGVETYINLIKNLISR